jgi:hypothetical protein
LSANADSLAACALMALSRLGQQHGCTRLAMVGPPRCAAPTLSIHQKEPTMFNRVSRPLALHCVVVTTLTCLGLAAVTAFAASPENATPAKSERAIKAQLEKSRQDCLAGITTQSLADCLNDAGGAALIARQGQSTPDDADTLLRNAMKRCEVHQGEEQALCMRRLQGSGKVSGTVAGGGLLYELTTIVPAPSSPEPKKE